MSARLLTAYVISVGLLAGIISQALAKPPDLPVKVQINCKKLSDKMVLKTYQVADLVIPVEGLPEGLPWAAEALPMPAEVVPPPAPYAAVPSPMPAPAVPMPLPPAPNGPTPPPVSYASPQYTYPQPFSFAPLPTIPPPMFYSSPVPSMPNVYEVVKAPKDCCPLCAAGKCAGCPSDSCCQCPACVAAGCAVPQAHAPQKTLEDRLIRLIVNTVKPESWDVNGGRGTIDFFPLGLAITVNQTPEIQEQVAQLLAGLRRLQDEQIAVEVRVISVPQGLGEKVVHELACATGKCDRTCSDVVVTDKEKNSGSFIFGTTGVNSDAGLSGSVCAHDSSSCPGCCSKDCKDKNGCKFSFLTDVQVKKFMDALQADPKTNVMMAPKVTGFNGQASTINITDLQFFVTYVKFHQQGEQSWFEPQNRPFETGHKLSMKPTVSTDHRFVQMSFEAEETSLDTPSDLVPLFPVTTFIKSINSDGSKGEPKPCTVFVQQPSLITQRVHEEFFVPCGKTALFKTWTNCGRVPEEVAVPILSWLPYIGRLFTTVGYHEETADVWVMITPRLINSQAEENRACMPPDSPATVTDNLEKLQHARALMEQAEHCQRMGQTESAQHIYEKVQELCPGSRYAQLARRRLNHLPVQQAARAPEPVIPSPMPVSPEGMVLTRIHRSSASEYVDKYWQACQEGRKSEAVQWAVQALALDPACFTKTHDASWKRKAHQTVIPSAN